MREQKWYGVPQESVLGPLQFNSQLGKGNSNQNMTQYLLEIIQLFFEDELKPIRCFAMKQEVVAERHGMLKN